MKGNNKPLIYMTRHIPAYLLEPYKDAFTFKMWDKAEEPVPYDVLVAECKHVDGLLCLLTDTIDSTIFEAGKHLKVVANMAVGYNNIDIDAAKENDVIVTNTPDVLTETTADLAFTLMLSTARRVLEANNLIRENKWKHWSPFLLAGEDVHHKTIGIAGMGRIGSAIAKRANGFGMQILYHGRTQQKEKEAELGAAYVSFDTLLERSDFVICVVPLTKETTDMFDWEAFQKMQSHAIFINISRGATVNEEDLVNALKQGEISGAGLDVFESEPIQADHPLMQLDNAICLPHIGSASVDTRSDMISLCLENLYNALSGIPVKTPVN